MKRLLVFMLGLALCGTLTLAAKDATAQKFLVVGGGSTTGVYYQVALNVCKIINDKLGSKGYNCIGRPALGSVFNINTIKRGLLNYGVAQSDRVWQAANGKRDWDGNPQKGLRTVFSAHPETVMLVARKDTGIKSHRGPQGQTREHRQPPVRDSAATPRRYCASRASTRTRTSMLKGCNSTRPTGRCRTRRSTRSFTP